MSAARRRALLSWSSGKDSAWALHVLRTRHPEIEVVGLLTTVNATHERVAMHAVRRRLLHLQAEAAGVPLREVEIPSPCTNEQYEQAMGAAVEAALADSVDTMAFGDLFLEDIRAYREEKLAGTGLEPIFPLWGTPTDALADEMLAAGLGATITCVDPNQVPRELCGRAWDRELLAALPDGADPCGENGEFHTFVHAGPMFSAPVPIARGEVVERDGFVFADLTPAAAESPR